MKNKILVTGTIITIFLLAMNVSAVCMKTGSSVTYLYYESTGDPILNKTIEGFNITNLNTGESTIIDNTASEGNIYGYLHITLGNVFSGQCFTNGDLIQIYHSKANSTIQFTAKESSTNWTENMFLNINPPSTPSNISLTNLSFPENQNLTINIRRTTSTPGAEGIYTFWLPEYLNDSLISVSVNDSNFNIYQSHFSNDSLIVWVFNGNISDTLNIEIVFEFSDAVSEGVHEIFADTLTENIEVEFNRSLIFSVTKNQAPSCTIQNLSYAEGDFVSASNYISCSDPDGDTLTVNYSMPLSEDGNWQTVNDDVGEYLITLLVSDGNYIIDYNFTITITDVFFGCERCNEASPGDGIVGWDDLAKNYNCFLGNDNCNFVKYQNWEQNTYCYECYLNSSV